MNVYTRRGKRPEPFAISFMSPVNVMTEAQSRLLQSLSAEANVTFDPKLTQMAAHERIIAIQDYLRSKRMA